MLECSQFWFPPPTKRRFSLNLERSLFVLVLQRFLFQAQSQSSFQLANVLVVGGYQVKPWFTTSSTSFRLPIQNIFGVPFMIHYAKMVMPCSLLSQMATKKFSYTSNNFFIISFLMTVLPSESMMSLLYNIFIVALWMSFFILCIVEDATNL